MGEGAREPKNPYAAPTAKLRTRRSAQRTRFGGARFESQRTSLLAAIALSTVTCGFYSWYWLFTRRSFVDSLDSEKKVGTALLPAALLTNLAGTALSRASADLAPVTLVVSITSLGLWGIVSYRFVQILRSHFARNGIHREVSPIAAFFLPTLYLQHVFNGATNMERDLEAAAEREERRKKKRKRRPPVEATVEPDEA